jgi:hypothetical protein
MMVRPGKILKRPVHGHGPEECGDVLGLAPTVASLIVAALGLPGDGGGVCRQNFEAAMAQQRTEIERLNNALSTLRQERDRVIMVSYGFTSSQSYVHVLAQFPTCMSTCRVIFILDVWQLCLCLVHAYVRIVPAHICTPCAQQVRQAWCMSAASCLLKRPVTVCVHAITPEWTVHHTITPPHAACMPSQADDVNSRLRTARSNLATANDKYQALLVGPSAKRLLELIGSPSPVPHGSEVWSFFAVQGEVAACD